MRAAICDAAAAVLADVGFLPLTMERVAEMAEVSKGTLYNYFRDKDELVLAVLNAAIAPFSARLEEVFSLSTRPSATLLEVTRLILQEVDEKQALSRVFCSGQLPAAAAERLRDFHLRVLRQITLLFEGARVSGCLRRDCAEPELAARLFFAGLRGLADERILYASGAPSLSKELEFLRQFMIEPWFEELSE